ncbi:MAG: leucine-rich repeat domain-containing protein [Deltaproteobacteria bacterium]|nr:leucine-rich repeat domain-containing protein [Deltaproteobacteria bacterium]
MRHQKRGDFYILGIILCAALLGAIACSKTIEESPRETKQSVSSKPAEPKPAVSETIEKKPSSPVSAEVMKACEPFVPPWGSGSWTEWGQNNPEEGEKWYGSVEETMTGADLTVLPKCTHLENLFVGFSSLTDLSPLAGLSNLKRLDLRMIGKLEDLTPIAKLPKLEYLNITGTNVQDFSPLTELPALAEIEARMLKMTDAAPIAKMSALEKIDLLKTPITDVTPMASAAKLAHILICTTQVEDVTPLIPVQKRIRSLDVCGTKFSDFKQLGKFEHLTMLRLTKMPIQDLGVIAGLEKMEKLDIGGTKVTDLSPIRKMTEMRELDISELELKDLSPLHRMKKLTKLYMVNSKVSAKQLEALKKAVPTVEITTDWGV